MELFWKTAAAILVAVILGLYLRKQERDIYLLLTLAVCCMAATASVALLEPVLDLLRELEQLASVQGELMEILMKAVGITLVTEIAGTICADADNGALGKMLQMAGSAAVLYLSIPLFRTFLRLIQEILGKL